MVEKPEDAENAQEFEKIIKRNNKIVLNIK